MENIVLKEYSVSCGFRDVKVYVRCLVDNNKLIHYQFLGCDENYHNCIKCKKCEEKIISLLQREYQ
jgi:hypothetical protein